MKHALLFLAQKVNYYIQLLTSLWHLAFLKIQGPKKEVGEEEVVEVLLNTSWVLFARLERTDAGGFAVDVAVKEFALPCFDARTDHSLRVLLKADEWHTFKVGDFVYDGKQLRSNKDRLVLVHMMLALTIHPLVHSMSNALYASHDTPGAENFDELFRHAQYINYAAHTRSGQSLRSLSQEEVRRVLEYNAIKSVPFHSNQGLEKFQHSMPYVNFCVKARQVVFRLVRVHKVRHHQTSLPFARTLSRPQLI